MFPLLVFTLASRLESFCDVVCVIDGSAPLKDLLEDTLRVYTAHLK